MRTKISFCIDFIAYMLKGGKGYYVWLLFLGFLIALMGYGSYVQFVEKGMIVTNLTDQVTWGVYLANFIFLVGVAAAAVTVVFPSYVYKQKKLKDVVAIGECLAITAVTMCMLFVFFHMGRPDRAWHLIPSFVPGTFSGIFNFPHSMLAWDVLVLNGYLALNLLCLFYYLYKKYADKEMNHSFYMPFVYIAIVWALSIHTVTAFLIATMPARPFWFHGMMPIKFISTAFASGPALIILTFLIVRKYTKLEIADEAINLLSQIIVFCLGLGLFLIMSEVVVELYPSTEHSFGLKYLIYGKHGLSMMVPFFWVSLACMITAFLMLLNPRMRKDHTLYLPIACVLVFLGVWIEKSIALVLPGQIPSPIGEFTEYAPSAIELINVAGVWATGLMLFTFLVKGTVGILLGDVKYSKTTVQILTIIGLASLLALPSGAVAEDYGPSPTDCFESREGATTVKKNDSEDPPNILCSPDTAGVLWWGDPYDDTVEMGEMPVEADYSHEEAVVRQRTKHLKNFMPCSICHNGAVVPFPETRDPRALKMHMDIVPDSLNIKHGKGAIWCLDCHNPMKRDSLISHRDEEISFNQPQRLCGKCHGLEYRDWRDGIHGKRIGTWTKGGKKRWWVCTECHNPHDVEGPFKQLSPEHAPLLPKGMTNIDHETEHHNPLVEHTGEGGHGDEGHDADTGH